LICFIASCDPPTPVRNMSSVVPAAVVTKDNVADYEKYAFN
jgi:hypothetical protein